MSWSITEVASIAGVSSRTLRHYDAIGLLKPAAVAANGYRFYGEPELLSLQQILAFKELGLGLSDIAAILNSDADPVARLQQLSAEFKMTMDRLERQRESIRRAIAIYQSGGALVPEELFDDFDHSQFQPEVEERWGKQAYASSDQWWRSMSQSQRAAWQAAGRELASDWAQAAASGVDPSSAEAQALAARQDRWLSAIPGTPGAGSGHADSAYLLGLGELYIADERFAANYGGQAGAAFVAASLQVFVQARDGAMEA